MGGYATSLGHVHLKVRDLGRSIAFYETVLGLRVTERAGGSYAFLSGGDAHHELALQQLGPGAAAPAVNAVGLYHTAWHVRDRMGFALAYNTLVRSGVAMSAVDHGISWALYFSDPDGNGVEIYLDRRAEAGGSAEWQGRSRALTAREIVPQLDGRMQVAGRREG